MTLRDRSFRPSPPRRVDLHDAEVVLVLRDDDAIALVVHADLLDASGEWVGRTVLRVVVASAESWPSLEVLALPFGVRDATWTVGDRSYDDVVPLELADTEGDSRLRFAARDGRAWEVRGTAVRWSPSDA